MRGVSPSLDFASALYLGLRHPSRCVPAWEQLTTGAPAALTRPPGAAEVSRRLALLQGCESATLAPSTLHLFWDFFGTFGGRPATVYVDEVTYPIALWGVERARALGARVYAFAHHDPDDLRRLLLRSARAGSAQLVVTDGFCPDCGRLAPLAEYLAAARSFGGRLILDDTQALGIFGEGPGRASPYGGGGGGGLRWHGLRDPLVLSISSLAKAFGVPLAVLAGGAEAVHGFEELSETRVHCSPPSVAVLHAARRALEINLESGDELRRRLALRVRHFRRRLREIGVTCRGGPFPVQTLQVGDSAARRIHAALLRASVKTILRRAHTREGAHLTFSITARHRRRDIDYATGLLARCLEPETRSA
ncbi:MAG TPA: aminotransferase class I/II-fold pyridoxal phosphate-dependent enzyme [Pyrinomonadaceae bacterium]